MNVQAVFDFLNQGWVGSTIGILGVVVAIVGILIAVRVARGPKPRLVYRARAISLLGSELRQQLPKDTVVLYKGNSVDRLTRTQLVVWNAGGATLDGADILKEDPLRWVFQTGGTILDVQLLKFKGPGTNIKFRVDPDPRWSDAVITCSFDYLDPGDGALAEILHTSPKPLPNGALGIIRGAPEGVEFWGELRPRLPDPRPHWLVFWVSGISAGAVTIYFLATLLADSFHIDSATMLMISIAAWIFVAIFQAVISLLVPGLGVLALSAIRRAPPRELLPDRP